MVAPKRGRGAKAANAKATPAAEDPTATETVAEENNGESVVDQTTDTAPAADESVEDAGGDEAPAAASEEVTEPKVEEKVEPGKLLVENLPASLLFEYQERLKEQFSKYGEVTGVKRGPIVVTELTTTPTLSAIVEFKNKDSLDKAVDENGTVMDGSRISVVVQPSTVDTTVLVGVPVEATNEYVRLLFGECGQVAQVQEFSKTKYKILRVTFTQKESVEKAMKLDRELRINGFLVTVTKYREDEEQRAVNNKNAAQNKRQHQPPQNRNNQPQNTQAGALARINNNRGGRGGYGGLPQPFRGRGARGGGGAGGFIGRGGMFVRGGGGGYRGGRGVMNMGRGGGYMGRGGYMMDGQRPNKRLRQE